MTIPAVSGDYALLPPGRHSATLAEMETYFVSQAPFSSERELLFQAFKTWLSIVDQLLPSSRYWVDGGFVTHKPWSAPSDVDVMILCKQEAVDALKQEEQTRLEQLFTSAAAGMPRFQPMGGLVDAFLCYRGTNGKADYWMKQWSRVKDSDGNEVLGVEKGFLEVLP
ncbi:hypothetical protein E3T23_01785 [Cryobacterium cheniae]|uniref:Uncharacterized protein n=1 Tax=Cryobacterium cheniae TaxID=1259262 RepID=A0A4R8XVM4_9MICO|nr:hypothetical protein [Cryobacterium cheniae]TFC83716.1 hypothetical protein E3T23_01785 [Cryobacterium cheniae]